MTRKIKREAIRRRTRRRNPRENPSRALQPGLQRPQRGTARSLVEVHRLRRSDAQVRLQTEPIGRGPRRGVAAEGISLFRKRLRTRGSLPRVCVSVCARVCVRARARPKGGAGFTSEPDGGVPAEERGQREVREQREAGEAEGGAGRVPEEHLEGDVLLLLLLRSLALSRPGLPPLPLLLLRSLSLSPHLLAADPAIPRATNMNTQRINRRALSRARTAFVPARVRAPRRGPFAAKKVLKEPYLLPSAPARTGSARTGDGRLEDR